MAVEAHWSAVRQPLTWDLSGRMLSFRCANGHGGTLPDHEVAEDGTVTPSVVCPEPSCDFHEHVRLMGWRADG